MQTRPLFLLCLAFFSATSILAGPLIYYRGGSGEPRTKMGPDPIQDFRQVCGSEIDRHCKKPPEGDAREHSRSLMECLAGHLNKKGDAGLGAECTKRVRKHQEWMQTFEKLRTTYKSDLEKHCPNANHRFFACLLQHRKDLSAKCRKALPKPDGMETF